MLHHAYAPACSLRHRITSSVEHFASQKKGQRIAALKIPLSVYFNSRFNALESELELERRAVAPDDHPDAVLARARGRNGLTVDRHAGALADADGNADTVIP